MTDLLLTAFAPSLSSGRGIRTYGITAALARHGPVELAYVAFGGHGVAPEYGALPTLTSSVVHASRGLRRGVSYLRARQCGVPSSLARGVSPELLGKARRTPPDVRVIADGPVVAAALLPLARDGSRELVYLAHNFESGFRTEWGAGDLEAFERTLLQSFSESWMATRSDLRAAIELGGDSVKARYVPNVVDVSRIEPVAQSGQERVLFIGDFTYEPNREGLAFLAGEVLPLVWERRPQLRVSVVGRGLSEPPSDPRIEALGFVRDLRTAYLASDAVAVPLLHGGGSPLKFVEGLAYGLPVVATQHAARLLEDGVQGTHFLAAGSAAEFAEALELVICDRGRASELGRAGRELACRCYSIDALAKLLSA
jgi:glycosyltransferase involved in cell wall biosynthesis